jgi:hypothetical protein
MQNDLQFVYSYWLRAGRPRGRSSSPGMGQDFSPLHVVQTGSGAHPASYPMGTGGPFPGGKAARDVKADHTPPTNAEAKNTWIIHQFPIRLHGVWYFI